MLLRGLLFLIPLLSLSSAQSYEPYNPVPAPEAVVVQGNTRVTVLSSTLVRFDKRRDSTLPFDDRATFSIVNRNLPVPSFTVTAVNATTVRIVTSALTISVTDGSSAKGDTCKSVLNATDAVGPVRSPTYPNGVTAAGNTTQRHTTLAECCSICNADTFCTAYVWAADASGFCWPLESMVGTQSGVGNRLLGGSPPASDGISVAFTGPLGSTVVWTPSTASIQNLNGTYSALDCYSTPMQCNAEYYERMREGLLSRDGWGSLTDTAVARTVAAPSNPAGLPYWWTLADAPLLDVYFQAHPSLDFKGALLDWSAVLGRPALLPHSAFGVWWSRYWQYTQQSIVEEVLQGYADNSIPLNNLVFDMDWHLEPADKTCESWGNWDVNTGDFPDMPGFARSLHEHGNVTGSPLKLSFNVHPQTGVDHCDSRYAEFAVRNGVDPASNKTIACDFGNQTFIDALYNVYMDTDPLKLVDIWWT